MAETSGVAAMDFFDTIQDMMDSNGRWDEFAGWKADSEKLKQLVPYHQTGINYVGSRSAKLPKTGSVHISQLSISSI
jgi:hypothetical protein